MGQQGEFQKIGKSEEKMYGPRKLLVCGYPEEDRPLFLSFLESVGFQDLPVIFISRSDSGLPLEKLLEREDKSGLGEPAGSERAVIMSGFTQKDLHKLISAYRQAGFPDQLWATLTPVSEKWPVGYLLKELSKEATAMSGRNSRRERV